jgi:hypothetical protein
MIGHQDVRMELTVLTPQGFAQPAEVGVAILVIEKQVPRLWPRCTMCSGTPSMWMRGRRGMEVVQQKLSLARMARLALT